MALRSIQGKSPLIHESAFVEESAQVIGDVTLGARSSIWFNCVVRGDVHSIRIGADTNLQDLCCVHVLSGRFGVTVGDKVTVGHHVTLHGCTVEDLCLIGMGATILDGAVVGRESIVAAGALVSPGTVIPPRSLAMGAPAKVKRPLTEEELATLARSAENYVGYAAMYRAERK